MYNILSAAARYADRRESFYARNTVVRRYMFSHGPNPKLGGYYNTF